MARAEEEIQSEVTSSMVNELPTKVDEFLEVIKLQKNPEELHRRREKLFPALTWIFYFLCMHGTRTR